LVLKISWVEGRKEEKEGRGGFCLEFGVGKCLRKIRKRGVLSRIWCLKNAWAQEGREGVLGSRV
jgi:hypothetical protein